MNNNTEPISRYLQNEMSAEEKAAFEKQLASDKDLHQELSVQQQIIKAAETAGLKTEFGKAIRKKVFNQRLLQWGIPALIVTAAFVIYAIKTNLFSRHTEGDKPKTESAEHFVINNMADTIIETKDGVVFGIPANAFGDAKHVELEIKTALTPYDIMRQGLSTMSNGSLLQTAGMFYINGYENGMPLELKKNIDVSVPANEVNPDMQLFKGEQDSTGNINWVNPMPVSRQLRTYDIATLDFYPPDYIPTLKALGKDYRNKKYTDSLYYSFSGYPSDMSATPYEINSADIVIDDKGIEGNGADQAVGYESDYFMPDAQKKKNDTTKKEPALEVIVNMDTLAKRFGDSVSLDYNSDTRHYEIDPARIGAIWNGKFNNTLLATKEFEERLRFLHGLCEREYFQAYVEGLDYKLYQIDSGCAANSNGEIRKKFHEFAARKDGGVMITSGMQGKLSSYFQTKYKAYQQAAAETWAKYNKELSRLNAIADKKQREQAISDFKRDSSNYEEEFCANLSEAYRQAGRKYKCNDTVPPSPPARDYYNVTIPATGWYNLDVFVAEVTDNRQSGTFTDQETGKKVTLTYNQVSIGIENLSGYDKVFVYLLPDGLSSFQRIEQKGDLFKDGLNSLFKYDAVAIGYKGTETFFFRQEGLQGGQYTFSLSPATASELKEALKYYSIQKGIDLQTEFEYRLFEQQEAIRQVQIRKDEEFRKQVAAAIFECSEETAGPWNVPSRPK